MSDDEQQPIQRKVPPPEGIEQRGIVIDVVVPIAENLVGGAAAGWGAGKVSQSKNPPPEKKE